MQRAAAVTGAPASAAAFAPLCPAEPSIGVSPGDQGATLEPPDGWLQLSAPDLTELEERLVQVALRAPQWFAGAMVEKFEAAFARWLGRAHAVAVPSGSVGTWLALPLHGQLTCDHVKFIVKTLMDSSLNVGAGASIY